MGAEFVHKCDKCGYSVSTSRPWEFYCDNKGMRKQYGHPVPFNKEAENAGIYGLTANVYCEKCDKVIRNIILVEFKKPARESLSVWAGKCEPKDEYKGRRAVMCPKCGNSNLILEPVKDREVTCPRCKEGKLMGEMVLIS
jgi:ribosomal protein S27E